MQTLQENTTLQGGKYRIISVLGQGGFGITYLAEQTMLERRVAIKEFYMKELCSRDGSTSHVTIGTEGSRETVQRFREKFLKEARNIAKLNHPNIVKIIDVFEENGTAYYVMEYAEGGSLADKVKREGYMSEPVATRYILQVAEALAYVHARKMNHLDVKPANIMLTGTDTAVLIDFGLSKQYDVGGQQTSTTPVGISEGYAPMEQYKQGGVGEFSPETDIYALGATFFKLLTGVTPPSASDVNEEGVPIDDLKAKGVSDKAIEVICEAMKPRKKDRMKDVRSFIVALGCNKGKTSTKIVEDEVTVMSVDAIRKEEKDKRPYWYVGKKIWWTIITLVILIGTGIIGYYQMASKNKTPVIVEDTVLNDNNKDDFQAENDAEVPSTKQENVVSDEKSMIKEERKVDGPSMKKPQNDYMVVDEIVYDTVEAFVIVEDTIAE